MNDDTPTYNLKAVVRETGLTPATLRAWERRYGLLKPQRSPGGHRLYSHNEIEMLKWLVRRQEEGLSISQAVELWRRGGHAEDAYPLSSMAAPAMGESGPVLERLRQAWVSACLAFDEQRAEQALAQAFASVAPEVVGAEILQKGLAEIGSGWYEGAISVQQEHFASALAMRRLHTLFAAVPPPTRPARILAACPPGEQHVFGLLMLSYLLRRGGWDVVYLGADVPFERLDAAIRHISPRLLLSGAETLPSAASLRDMANFGIEQGVPLAYGGGIFNHLPSLRESIPGHFLGSHIEEVPPQVERLLTQPHALPEPQVLSPETRLLLAFYLQHEPWIIREVTEAMQQRHLKPAHIEAANLHLTRNIVAALKLGNVAYLDYTAGWLEGLLENHGLSPALAASYYQAYASSMHKHLGSQAALIENWLTKAAENVH
jgi:DNA-binding transcriptional MerR regulator